MTPAAAPATLLAFDYGTRRTGVAVGNTLLRQAQPLATLAAEGDAVFAQAAPLMRGLRLSCIDAACVSLAAIRPPQPAGALPGAALQR